MLVGLAFVYLAVVSTLYTATSTVLVDPRRANVVETNQSVLSNFGTDDATIESQTLLIQSVAILERVVRKLKLTDDAGVHAAPGLLDPIRRLFCQQRSRVTGRTPRTPRVRDRWKSCRSE